MPATTTTTTTNPSLSKHEKPCIVRSTRKLGAIFGTRTVFGTTPRTVFGTSTMRGAVFGTSTTRGAVFGTRVVDSEVDVIRITLPSPSPPPRARTPFPPSPRRTPPPPPPRAKTTHSHGSIFTVFPDLNPTPREHEGESESGSMYSCLTIVQQEPGVELSTDSRSSAKLSTDPLPPADLPTPASFSSSRAKRWKGAVEGPPSLAVEGPPSLAVKRPLLNSPEPT
ncbi:hypothetical protein BDY19DRAFT_979621 [Irpex rosettiformis]|uniref:Uncharacterized protein n=1 Tax=Irpex rosettiformis TaxID=378272 RepID=A0ACB8TMU7_9APHY|nr:hypothetical protein BDY19DRAFT_979621 [Irpex rosettiformis]